MARLGVVIPSVNTVVEPWYSRVVPDGVTVHFARMFLKPRVTAEAVAEMDREDGMRAVRQLRSCRPDVIAYGCTASSVVGGPDYDRHLREGVAQEGGVPATSVTHSILVAFERLGVNRAVILSPYPLEIDQAERRYFFESGLDVLHSFGMGIEDSFRLAEPSGAEIYEAARKHWDNRAEALLLTCLNFRSHEVIEALEEALSRPVITATQATLWHLIRMAGVQEAIPGYGRLMAL